VQLGDLDDGDLDGHELGDVSNHQGRDGAHELGSFWFGSTGTLVLALDDGDLDGDLDGTVVPGLVRFGSVHEPRRGPRRDGRSWPGSFRFGSRTSTCTSSGTGTLVLALDDGTSTGTSCSSGTCRTSTGPRRRGRVEPPRPGRCSRAWFVSVRFTANLDGDLDDAKLGDVSNHQGRDGRSWPGSFWFGSTGTEPGTSSGTGTLVLALDDGTSTTGTRRTTKAGTVLTSLVRFGSVRRGRSCWPSTTGTSTGRSFLAWFVSVRFTNLDGDARAARGRVEPPRPGRCSRAWFVLVRLTDLDGNLDDAKLGDRTGPTCLGRCCKS
jgi:hypothetical protein